jgi:hypothetical protein
MTKTKRDLQAQDFKANEIEFGSILIEQMCELPDRNSPEDEPDAIVATPAEVRGCIERALDKYCFVIAGAGDDAAPAQSEAFPYQKTFDAIAAATSVSAGRVAISVIKFREAFGVAAQPASGGDA